MDHALRNTILHRGSVAPHCKTPKKGGAGPGNAIPQEALCLVLETCSACMHPKASLSVWPPSVCMCMLRGMGGMSYLGTHTIGPTQPRLRIWPFGLSPVTDPEVTAHSPRVPEKKEHSTTITVSPSHVSKADTHRLRISDRRSLSSNLFLGLRGPRDPEQL